MVEETWPWAEANAEAISEHWTRAKAAKPALFDGQVVIAKRIEIATSVLVSSHIPVPYSALLYWQSLGFPDAEAFNLFGAGVVVTRDGAVLLGRMAAHTANAGRVYFPCGTPDLDDVVDGRLDIEGSITRELEEETGLGAAHLTPTDQRWIVWDGGLFGCTRRYETHLSASEVAAICTAHIAADPKSELDEVCLVRSPDELDERAAPAYAVALVAAALA